MQRLLDEIVLTASLPSEIGKVTGGFEKISTDLQKPLEAGKPAFTKGSVAEAIWR
ncbi:hypothetical protein I5P84_15635 [Pseudomonas mosselii]|uniref:hypothetical protein n=1 Tax=Pseudomonas mosselii TaxID=78327 RepID=UPI0018D69DFC|nr:hypothetical protein [Pseudomonas mosselii]MBH3310867.1 hypothetical protein [Pseudomonas mosselii]MBH3323328.1 hypothetical protein [Pseudomonas mosselii]